MRGFWATLRQLKDLLSPRERGRLIRIGAAVSGSALLETLTVLALVPFMAVVASADAMYEQAGLVRLHTALGSPDFAGFVMMLGAGVLCIVILSNAISAVVTWRLQRFVWDQHHDLSRRLLLRYLHQPYTFFLGRNSSELSKNILSEVEVVVTGIVLPLMFSAARGVLAVFLVSMLMLVDPKVAVVSISLIGGAYGLIYWMVRGPLGREGQARLAANSERYRRAAEALAGVKAVKILGMEEAFIGRFTSPSLAFTRATSNREVFAVVPRYALEAVAFGGITVLVMLVLGRPGGPQGVLPVVALYGFAGLKLLPALQQIFASFATMRFYTPALERLHDDLMEPSPARDAEAVLAASPSEGPLVTLRDVSLRYPDAPDMALRGVSMEIMQGRLHGVVGTTGAGKTSVSDLVLGLLTPESGEVTVAGDVLSPSRVQAWRSRVGYVPQEIFLSDDTLRGNIAFGLDPHDIDEERLARAVKAAQLDLVVAELANGLDTPVGERGVRLSGGQRQRIGVARALYRSPEMLVMDEATSALDPATEREIVAGLRSIGVTVLWVTHRLVTVEGFDTIFVMEGGRLVAQGTHAELSAGSAPYQLLLGGDDGAS